MKQFEAAYVPIGVPTFHLETAGDEFEKSKKLLKSIYPEIKCPSEILLSVGKLDEFLDTLNPDIVILQNTTFANAQYCSEVLRKCGCPVLLWTLREPKSDGGKLKLNSLTGAFSASNMLSQCGGKLAEYVFGSPEEDDVKKTIESVIKTSELLYKLKSMTIAQIGHTPQGFGFGRANDAEIQKNFGLGLISVEARELIEKAKSFSDDDIKSYLEDASKRIKGLYNIDKKNVLDFARLYRVYDEFVKENNIAAISSRCWPDFFTSFGTPVCAVLAMMNDLGVSAACEADTYGALSMLISSYFTDSPAFFGDPVALDEKENTVTFWHCGTAACSLAREDTGAEAGVHCNRKIGPTLEFGCKPCDRVTIFRVGKKPDGTFRFFVCSGEALDKPKQYTGTSVVVKTDANSKELIMKAVKDGFEPHFAVAFGDIDKELSILANLLGIEVWRF